MTWFTCATRYKWAKKKTNHHFCNNNKEKHKVSMLWSVLFMMCWLHLVVDSLEIWGENKNAIMNAILRSCIMTLCADTSFSSCTLTFLIVCSVYFGFRFKLLDEFQIGQIWIRQINVFRVYNCFRRATSFSNKRKYTFIIYWRLENKKHLYKWY